MKKTICICLMFMFAAQLKADIGSFDVIEFSLDGETYYHRFTKFGLFKENDLQGYYNYDYEGDLIMHDVSELVKNKIRAGYPVSFFKTILTINKNKLLPPNWLVETFENKQYVILKDMTEPKIYELNDSFKVLGLYKGNTFGYIFSEELNYNDIHWINNYTLEHLCKFDDPEGICDYHLFGIRGNTTKKELEIILKRLQGKFLPENSSVNDTIRNIKKTLSKLHKQNIIMVGFCSC